MLPNRKDSRYKWEILKILFIWFVICGCVIFQRIFFNQCYTLNILEIKFSLAISYDIAKGLVFRLMRISHAKLHLSRSCLLHRIRYIVHG